MSGVLKNFIDIVMYAFSDKNFGVLINAGGPNSFMAGRDIMDSIFYQVGATPLYPHVYTHAMHFEDGVLTDQKAISKIDELIEKII